MTELEHRKHKALEAAKVDHRDLETVAITKAEYYGECLDDNMVWDMVKESPELNHYSIISDPNNPSNKWTPIAYIRHNIVTAIREHVKRNL
ncbi:hypothetical protein LCGC14_1635310 [marine sediment metagenome]|uniref:Uncharacterized protein n=1 Tax=marine sediment metagenome TaxID=412755 RepID=A0A0F9KGZ4_9ZZZZ